MTPPALRGFALSPPAPRGFAMSPPPAASGGEPQ